MPFGIDILEDEIMSWGHEILETLLLDRTTGENIIWATDDYMSRGEGYGFHDHITIERITGEHKMVIRPRVLKTKERQTGRSKVMAEVFTPSWVCNAQNNLVDEAWLGRNNVFNVESENSKTWEATSEKIEFTGEKNWKDYVHSKRLEITCGEAPYLVSRYDTTTGISIPIEQRIGLLDRKLRVVGENTETTDDWLYWAQVAYKNIYGYEWQGDNLLLAREALLLTFIEYYQEKFNGEMPSYENIRDIVSIVSWNLWQMDGLKGVVPESCHNGIRKETDMFGNVKEIEEKCPGCKKKLGNVWGHNGIYCAIVELAKTKGYAEIDNMLALDYFYWQELQIDIPIDEVIEEEKPDVMFESMESAHEFVTIIKRKVGASEQESDQVSDQVNDQVSDQVSDQVRDQVSDQASIAKPRLTKVQKDIVNFCSVPRSAQEILNRLGLSNHSVNKKKHIQPLIEMGVLEMTNPENPNASNQRYRKVRKGK